MRAVLLDFEESEGREATAELAPATVGPRRASVRGAAGAAWLAAPALVRLMFCLDLAMGLLYFFSRRARNVIAKPLLNFFDLNGEQNLPSWYSAGQLALIGGLLVAFAAAELRRGVRAAWALMLGGLAFLFLSLDEMTSLHENFGYWLDKHQHRRTTVFDETGFWMLFCAPLFLVVVVLLGLGARRYLRGQRHVMTKFVAGVAIYIAAAAGVEALSNFVTPQGAAARALVLAEEMGEMIGATFVLWGAIELLRSHGLRLMVDETRGERALSQTSS